MNFLDNLISSVKGLFAGPQVKPINVPRPAPAHLSTYDQEMKMLNDAQSRFDNNPSVQQIRKNSQLVLNYRPKVNLPAPYNNPNAQNPTPVPQASDQASLSDYVPQRNYASYLPFLQQLGQQTIQHPMTQMSTDISPYLSAASTIQQRRQNASGGLG